MIRQYIRKILKESMVNQLAQDYAIIQAKGDVDGEERWAIILWNVSEAKQYFEDTIYDSNNNEEDIVYSIYDPGFIKGRLFASKPGYSCGLNATVQLRNGIFHNVPSATQCQDKCAHRTLCRSWEYNNSVCALYSTNPSCGDANEACYIHVNILESIDLATLACGFLKSWHVSDTKMKTSNPNTQRLLANSSSAVLLFLNAVVTCIPAITTIPTVLTAAKAL